METILDYSTHFAYFYVGLFLFLGSLGLPFPEEIILLSAGYLAGTGVVRLWLMLPYAMGILIISDNVTYYISRRLGRGFILKWGHYVFFPVNRLERLEDYYRKHGNKTVFFSRLLIGFRFVGIMVAGITKMPWKKFFAYDLLSIIVYLPIVLGLGYLFHYHLDLVLRDFQVLKHAVFVIVIVLILIWFIKILIAASAGPTDKNNP